MLSSVSSIMSLPCSQPFHGSHLVQIQTTILTVACRTQQDLPFSPVSDLTHLLPLFPFPVLPHCPRAPPHPTRQLLVPPLKCPSFATLCPGWAASLQVNVLSVSFPRHPQYSRKKPLSKYSFPLPYLFSKKNFNVSHSILFTGLLCIFFIALPC